ncbi:MAG: hypothetical protein EAZ78_20100 [Oscillatoriales cyanobacterium]|uniref:hypothetical protein n=1 Tax=Microcoleus anatoxicus TaxID=2705319 RepID=UPI002975759B|nr:MAG: hypothetical protein EA000_08470 [Oscillatoriales cyanobacterium]TAE01431.1 MAG: hypothetical protein EAZ98_03320 [Oscillatoriales cyanobacterium]TAE02213.1 MAG: hypothetical protein EAZ96_16730 [Oscillatoriales cyanobacterium]TAF00582.1 MAG: hypothetical protein EAZ78_20100 [Oscillatoriales cyanobacterium]TAF37852.1 MAG: hypothetical protein EAZ68_13810 [Oscillatoriales cyanobacterium]
MILLNWNRINITGERGRSLLKHKNHQRVVPGLALCNSGRKQPILKGEFSVIANPGDAPPFWSIANSRLHLDK